MNAATPERWAQFWRQATAARDPNRVYQELVGRYAEPHRHYHNLTHIAECLAEFDAARQLAKNPVAVELAIWFHDAVYDTHASDNEEKSAELAKRRVEEAGGSTALCETVAALVLVTKTHCPAVEPDGALFIDVDLSILGQNQTRFQAYESQIRREYQWVPESTFVSKRSEILERFLARERIYSTEPFFAKYERQARCNLQESIRRLKSS